MKFRILLLLFFIFISSQLFSAPRISVSDTQVIINNITVINFRTSLDYQTPQDRANYAFFQLSELSSDDLLNGNITVSQKSDEVPYCIIRINNVPVTAVTDQDGKSLNSTCEGIAHVWAKNIKEAIKACPLYMSESEGIIPLNEKRTKNIYGFATDNITVTNENPNICSVDFSQSEKTITVTGLKLGFANLIISNGTDTVNYGIYIRKYAADFPNTIDLTVTGSPAPSDLIKETIDKAAQRQIKTEQRAEYRINSVNWTKKSLYPGDKTVATVNVTAYGDEYISVTKNISFAITNRSLKIGEPNTLLYSNNPETVEFFQDLYLGELQSGKCNRLLYHHMNRTGQTGTFIIEVINPSEEDVSLRVRKACAKPIVDTIAIGVVAGKSFIEQNEANVSSVETIPAKSRVCFVADTLKNKYSSSGIIQFWQMNGSRNCIVRVKLSKPENANVTLNQAKEYMGNGEFAFSDYVFDNPKEVFDETYQCGGRFVFIHVGKKALENQKHLKLYGNYGVDYECNITIENPTDKKSKVRVYLDPGAGSIAAFLKINNEYRTIHHVKPPNETDLAVYTLEPGETRKLTIKTIPLSGSSYPAKIIVGTPKTP